MNIWSKVITALQLGAYADSDSLIDSHAMRILEQERKNTEHSLEQLNHSLEQFTRKKIHAGQQLIQTQADINQYESYAKQALSQKNDTLARDIANKIADLEQTQAKLKLTIADSQSQKDQLRTAIDLTEQNLLRIHQQIEVVRASENVHKAQEVILNRNAKPNSSQSKMANGKIPTAMDALERLKQRQSSHPVNIISAMGASASTAFPNISPELVKDAQLRQKLIEAGIIADSDSEEKAKKSDVEAILARIKEKKQGKK